MLTLLKVGIIGSFTADSFTAAGHMLNVCILTAGTGPLLQSFQQPAGTGGAHTAQGRHQWQLSSLLTVLLLQDIC